MPRHTIRDARGDTFRGEVRWTDRRRGGSPANLARVSEIISQKGKDFREELFTDTLDILSMVDPKIKSMGDQYLN
ncbi:hypothetical protein PTI98_012522 [Pleurotus ostreatus]|nr:hypothetical protein PTI98_012522 [Pleurotus ostreatus]